MSTIEDPLEDIIFRRIKQLQKKTIYQVIQYKIYYFSL